MTRILLFLFAFLMGTPAFAGVEISLYSHEMGGLKEEFSFPHAFYTLKGTPDAGGPAINESHGFTVYDAGPKILWTSVPGVMENPTRSYIRQSRLHLTVTISDAQLAAVRAAHAEWAKVGGKSYSLNKRNCIHFIAEIAKAAGLALPNVPKLMKKPRSYLIALVAKNPGVGVPVHQPTIEEERAKERAVAAKRQPVSTP